MSDEKPIGVKIVSPKPARFEQPKNTMPLYYINGWGAQSGTSEITLKLGHIVADTGDEQIVQEDVNIVFTHDGFMKFVKTLIPVMELFKTAYGDHLPNMEMTSERALEMAAHLNNEESGSE